MIDNRVLEGNFKMRVGSRKNGQRIAFRRHLDKYVDRKDLEGCGTNMGKWDQFRWATWSSWAMTL